MFRCHAVSLFYGNPFRHCVVLTSLRFAVGHHNVVFRVITNILQPKIGNTTIVFTGARVGLGAQFRAEIVHHYFALPSSLKDNAPLLPFSDLWV